MPQTQIQGRSIIQVGISSPSLEIRMTELNRQRTPEQSISLKILVGAQGFEPWTR